MMTISSLKRYQAVIAALVVIITTSSLLFRQELTGYESIAASPNEAILSQVLFQQTVLSANVQSPLDTKGTQDVKDLEQKITHQFSKNLVSQSLIADVQKRSNLEPAFTENFCRYTLWALRFQPKVCLYDPADDVHVSGMIIGSGHWEYTGVATLLEKLLRYKEKFGTENVFFLDVGANLGAYALAIASHGVNVVAVEPLKETVERLATSIVLNKYEHLVSLVAHPLSNRSEECMSYNVVQDNRGGTQASKVACNVTGESRKDTSVSLDDLFAPMILLNSPLMHIVMKMDIEAFEVYAILGGKKFFKTKTVKILLMEWLQIRLKVNQTTEKGGNLDYSKLVDDAMESLVKEAHYSIYNFPEFRPISYGSEMFTDSVTENIILAQPGYWDGSNTELAA